MMPFTMKDAATAHPWLAENRDFRTTHWSVIALAGGAEGDSAAAALSALCRTYWRPLHAFVRRRGHDDEEAKDLTQAFFAMLLRRNDMTTASRARGRFRTYLLSAMTHFLANDRRDSQRLKRGGGEVIVSLDEVAADSPNALAHQPANDDSPERDYDRQWVRALLTRVLERMTQEAAATGRAETFAVLKTFLTGDKGELSYTQAATKLGMTEAAIKPAIHRLRLRYGEVFREEVAHTIADPEDLEQEIKHLLAVMS